MPPLQSSPSHRHLTAPNESAALIQSFSTDRLSTYSTHTSSNGPINLDLYLWDQDLAAAAIADIAILEVALRNAMNSRLAILAGRPEWYAATIGLDDRSLNGIKRAWGDIPSNRRTPGRMVAQLMLGFWRDLLETGGKIDGKTPREQNADYEKMWRDGLKDAFPGGRIIARSRSEQFSRTWMLDLVQKVHALRNRASHHEPLINGVKMPGQHGRRITAAEAHESCVLLARVLDRDLGTWFARNSRMAPIIRLRPPVSNIEYTI
jgi:hypothetical protein